MDSKTIDGKTYLNTIRPFFFVFAFGFVVEKFLIFISFYFAFNIQVEPSTSSIRELELEKFVEQPLIWNGIDFKVVEAKEFKDDPLLKELGYVVARRLFVSGLNAHQTKVRIFLFFHVYTYSSSFSNNFFILFYLGICTRIL